MRQQCQELEQTDDFVAGGARRNEMSAAAARAHFGATQQAAPE
jgi:hypothetical protein